MKSQYINYILLCLLFLTNCKEKTLPPPKPVTQVPQTINTTTAVIPVLTKLNDSKASLNGIIYSKKTDITINDTANQSHIVTQPILNTNKVSYSENFVTLSDLTPNTTYFYRSYARYDPDRSLSTPYKYRYGSEISFTTKKGSYFTDQADNKKYPMVSICNKKWLSKNYENVHKATTVIRSKKFKDSISTFYTFNDAQKACPSGWHLPSINEWKQMLNSLGVAKHKLNKEIPFSVKENYKNQILYPGKTAWESGAYYKNLTGLSIKGSGIASINDDKVKEKKLSAYYWTSTDTTIKGKSYGVFLIIDPSDIHIGWRGKGSRLSVRCIKN